MREKTNLVTPVLLERPPHTPSQLATMGGLQIGFLVKLRLRPMEVPTNVPEPGLAENLRKPYLEL